MNKQQILDLITGDLRAKIAGVLPDEINLSEKGEQQLHEAVLRAYMNHPNVACANEWTREIASCECILF